VIHNNLPEPVKVEVAEAAGGKLTLAAHETRRIEYDTMDRF
jgi:hypothetical protein